MGEDRCGCGHCDCEKEELTTEEKVDALKAALADLGYGVEETGEGEIRISE